MAFRRTLAPLAAAAALAFALPAQALTTTGAACAGNGTTMVAISGYAGCAGSFAGNTNNQDVAGFLSSEWGLSGLTATSISGSAGASGSLSFAQQTGQFAIALKAGNAFSLYRFDASGIAGGISSISFDTLGVGFVSGGNGKMHFGQNLSHAVLYTAQVPEPETYALMLLGLAGVAAVARRRPR